MKILLINKFYYLKGGTERYFFNLKELLEKEGHTVIPFSMQDERNFETEHSQYFIKNIDFNKQENIFRQIRKAGHLIYSFEARKKLKELIKQEKPDIAHIHNIAHQISPSILSLLKRYKIPIIQTLHDFKLICPNYQLFIQGNICERCKRHKYYQAVIHKCLKNSLTASSVVCAEMYLHHSILKTYKKYIDLFISPSQFLKDKMVEWGWDKNKIVCLSNFINPEDFNIIKDNQSKTSNYLIYVGRISPEKGIDILINSMQYVNRDIRLKIIGRGMMLSDFRFMISDLGLDERVELLGHKEGKKLYDLIGNAMFVVVPSLWYENFPYSILESFAFGKSVVGSKIGGIPELIKEGKTGLLFKPGDPKELAEKINYLFDHPDKVKEMGLTAKENVVRYFNPSDHYKKVEEVYNSLIC